MKYKMLIPIEKNIEHYAGEEICQKVMAGSEEITEKTDKKKMALWTKDAMDRLDAAVDEEKRIKIMNQCGSNCAEINKRVLQKAVDRRKKFRTFEEFLKAEIEKPQKGTRFEQEGKKLIHIYTPQAFTHPMRCYCDLIRALPSNVNMSETYCHCSEGFIKKYWETITGKPVNVKLLESAVSGSSECKFAVEF
ncbi:MAG: DUF6144 family protein [Candidatus Bathyarchaeia archaeon]